MPDPIKTAVNLMIEACRANGLNLEFFIANVSEAKVANFVADESVTGTTITVRCAFSEVSEEIVAEYVVDVTICKPDFQVLYRGSSTVQGTLYEAAGEAATRVCHRLYDYRFPPTELFAEP